MNGLWSGAKSFLKQPAVQGVAATAISIFVGIPGLIAAAGGAAVGLASNYMDLRSHESDNALASLKQEVEILEKQKQIGGVNIKILERKAVIALISMLDAHETRNTASLLAHLLVGCIFSFLGCYMWVDDIFIPPENIPWHAAVAAASKNLVHSIIPFAMFSLSMIIVLRVSWFSESQAFTEFRQTVANQLEGRASHQALPSTGPIIEEIDDDEGNHNKKLLSY